MLPLRVLLFTVVYCIMTSEARCACNLFDSDEDDVIFECDLAELTDDQSSGSSNSYEDDNEDDDDDDVDFSISISSDENIYSNRRGNDRNGNRNYNGGRYNNGGRNGYRRNGNGNFQDDEDEKIHRHILKLAQKNDELAEKVDQIPMLLKQVCNSANQGNGGGNNGGVLVITPDGNGGSQLIPLSNVGNGPIILSASGITRPGPINGGNLQNGSSRNNYRPNSGYGPSSGSNMNWRRSRNNFGDSGGPSGGRPRFPGGPVGPGFPPRGSMNSHLNCRCDNCKIKGQ